MSDLILVKHAAVHIIEGTRAWELSDAGVRQCEGLSGRLAEYQPTQLFSSEEPKAIQTADIVASNLTISCQPLPGLHENDRTDFPFFVNEAEFNGRIRDFFSRPSERVIGRESADEAHDRFRRAVRGATAGAKGETISVVAHGAVISLLVARANQLSPYPFWLDLELTSFAVLSVPSFALKRVVHPSAK